MDGLEWGIGWHAYPQAEGDAIRASAPSSGLRPGRLLKNPFPLSLLAELILQLI